MVFYPPKSDIYWEPIKNILSGLNDIDWENLEHAYDVANDIPKDIADLLAESKEVRINAIGLIWGNIFYQDTLILNNNFYQFLLFYIF